MVSRIWSKKFTQETIKGMRDVGYVVDKVNSGYVSKIDDKVIFKAMIGSNGYLVRYDAELFTPK